MKWWEAIKNYYQSLSDKYDVNPVIFLGIHVVATPLLMLTLWWVVRNSRLKKPLIAPVLASLFFFNAANIYLVAVGHNVPVWIYIVITILTVYSGYITYKKVMKKISA